MPHSSRSTPLLHHRRPGVTLEPEPPAPVAPRDCVTTHAGIDGHVTLYAHDRAGRVQLEVRIPAASMARGHWSARVLGWLRDAETAGAIAPQDAVRKLAARPTPPSPRR